MSGTRDQGNILGAMPVDRLVLTMSAPIMVSMLVSAVYNLVDSIYVAQVSDLDFLALSYAYPVQLMMVAFCTGIGVGFNATFAQRLGEGKGEEANRVACHGFLFYTLCWLLFLAFALFGAPLFFRLSTDDPVVAQAGVQYLTICCGASIGMCMQFLTERLLQTTGHPAGFMIVQGSGAVLNIVLDPVFIFGFDMGVAGAAVATVLSQLGSCLYVLRFLFSKSVPIPISFGGYEIRVMLRILAVGLTPFLIVGVDNVMIIAMNAILQSYGGAELGDRLVTCATIAQSFMLVVTMPLGGISAGTGTILAYNYGARRRDRILKAQAFIAGLCVAYVTALFLLARLGGALFVRLFTTEPELAAEALDAIHVCTLAIIPLGIQYAIVDGFTGMGKVQVSLPLSAFRKAVYFIALFALPAAFGARATFYAEPISDILGPIVSIAVYALVIRRLLNFPPAGEEPLPT